MSLANTTSCVHGIDFSSRCADCAAQTQKAMAHVEQSARDKHAAFIREMVIAQTAAGNIPSEGSAVVAIDVAESTWKALEQRGYV